MTRQSFHTDEVVAFNIERDPEPGEYVNASPNPSGELGGWWWRSPVADTIVTGQPFPEEWDELGHTLTFKTNASQACAFTSGQVPISAGQWLTLTYRDWPGVLWHRVRFDWYDVTGSLISSTTRSAYWNTGGVVTPRDYGSHQAPAGTFYARLRVDLYATNSGGNPAADTSWTFNRVSLVVTDTEPDASPADVPEVLWTNVMGDALSVNFTREGGNVGPLSAELVSDALDPATNPLLRPGRRVQVRTENAVMYTGRLAPRGVRAVYNPLAKPGQRTRISLAANDAWSDLAASPCSDGVSSIVRLPMLLENAVPAVPWNANGYASQVDYFTPSTTGDTSATLADQIIRARDTDVPQFAWIDRNGILQAWFYDPDNAPWENGPRDLTEADYNRDLTVAHDTGNAINVVRFNVLSGTTTTPYGPYIDTDSLREWGNLSATFTIHARGDYADYAEQILDAASVPVLAPESAVIPLPDLAAVEKWADLDLYDVLAIECTDPAITAQAHASRITHTITPDKWLLGVTFQLVGRPAIPTA